MGRSIYNPSTGDTAEGDDPAIRRAALAALGTRHGSIVVVDPSNGRVLSMVNQKLALQSGFIPCSTIKLVTALAALTEHVVERDTTLHFSRYTSFDLTKALAVSNNQYFAVLGNRLGFERVTHYAQMLGLGEKAGLDIEGEQAGEIAAEPPKDGGVGRMTSFGEGFLMTPLELAAMLGAIANGGTLYYLQYPQSFDEGEHLTPQVKRTLEVAPQSIEDVKAGMRGAVTFGTARQAAYDPNDALYGKTGTCNDYRAGYFMGWFGSFNSAGPHPLAVVVMLTSYSNTVSGPLASAVAGAFYRNLAGQRYFAGGSRAGSGLPEILVTSPCCAR